MCAAVYCVSEAKPLEYLTKIIQGQLANVYIVLVADTLVYLTKIIQGLVA